MSDRPKTDSETSCFRIRVLGLVNGLGLLVTVTLLLALCLRAIVQLDLGFDTTWYHIPLSSMRGGLGLSYIPDEQAMFYYQGFPPLPHLVQGLLWRMTGSMNAVCTVNLLAFGLFLTFCVTALKVRFWVVALVALTAPLVLIHATSGYIDLFSNSFCAIGVAGTFYYFYADQKDNLSLITWILVGSAAATWCRFQLVPISFALLFILLVVSATKSRFRPERHLLVLILVAVSMVVAALPYLDNLIEYGNPFWPFSVPGLAETFPYALGSAPGESTATRGMLLQDADRFTLFIHSLFEIDHPTHYDYRSRWIVGQGSSWVAYRMGGFWATGVVAALLSLVGSSLLLNWRRGLILAGSFAVLLAFTAAMPESNQLRYYMYLPLVWAALLGVVYGQLERRRPVLTVVLYAAHIALFAYVVTFNLDHLTFEERTYTSITEDYGYPEYWEGLDSETDYCAVGYRNTGIFLSGPTCREYNVVSRGAHQDCPEGTRMIFHPNYSLQ